MPGTKRHQKAKTAKTPSPPLPYPLPGGTFFHKRGNFFKPTYPPKSKILSPCRYPLLPSLAPELLTHKRSYKMNKNIDILVEDFLGFLNKKSQYLTNVKIFLLSIPELFPKGKISEMEFQNFMEKYEMETAAFLSEKNWYQEKIAEKLNVPKEQVTFKLLLNLGYNDFEATGRKVLRISNEITMLLFKISIYIKNYFKLQREFVGLNNFLYQKDYSARGMEMPYHPGKTFYGEA
jgi:hypothetical protein